MTKPAGCFLQVLAVPVFLWAVIVIAGALGPGSLGGGLLGAFLLTLSVWMLVAGGRPARRG